ncbi:MAG: RNA polymerase sigma factor [Myxococcota bacterium]
MEHPDATPGPTGARSTTLQDAEVLERVRQGELGLFEVLMRRYNRRTFRVVRGIVRSDAEAEDVTQDAWLAAYKGLASFEGRAAFSTWLTRIAIRCAMARVRRERTLQSLDELEAWDPEAPGPAPDQRAERDQMATLLEAAIDRLPGSYRLVVMLRDVEQMASAEAAEVLGVTEQNLRVRLHRARALLRDRLVCELGDAAQDVFRFEGARCDRMVAAVLGRLRGSA